LKGTDMKKKESSRMKFLKAMIKIKKGGKGGRKK
jgi:hypothetical protein